jgi:hypothetical protein
MEKITVVLKVIPEWTKGCAQWPEPVTETDIWEALVANIPKDGKHIHHILEGEWKENSAYSSHIPKNWDGTSYMQVQFRKVI